MNVTSTQRPIEQMSHGQGQIERHEFYKHDSLVGYIDTEQWLNDGLLLLSGELRVFSKRKKQVQR